MIEPFELFEDVNEESVLSDAVWKGLDKLAIYLHRNPDVKDAVSSSMAELSDDVMSAFMDGVKGSDTLRYERRAKDRRYDF